MARTIAVFAGEYDARSKARLRAILARWRDSEDLVLDLTEVTFIDSTAVAELIAMAAARSNKQLARAAVIVANPIVDRLFSVLDLGAVFRLAPTLDEALARDGQPATVEYAFCGDDGNGHVPQDYAMPAR